MNYTPEWLHDLVINFENKVNSFYQNYNGIKNVSVPISLTNTKNSLMSRGAVINEKIASAKQSVITAKAWLNGLKGMVGLGSTDLGLLPLLVPAVVITGIGGLTALGIIITVYIADCAKFSSQLNQEIKIQKS